MSKQLRRSNIHTGRYEYRGEEQEGVLGQIQRQAGMSQYRGPRDYSTGYSSAAGGQVSMDPSIRRLQDEALQRTNALYGDVGQASSQYVSRLGDIRRRGEAVTGEYVTGQKGLRGQYEGNQAGYIQARVNPILQQSALRRGELQRAHGLRQIGGSSFANQDYTNLSLDTARAEAEARALGTRENLDTLRAIDTDILGAQQGNLEFGRGVEGDVYGNIRDRIGTQAALNQENYQVSKDRLTQELSALGLSKEQIKQQMDIFEAEQNRRVGTNRSIGESFAGMFKIGGGGGGSG